MIGRVDHIHKISGQGRAVCARRLLVRQLPVHHRHDQRQVCQRWEVKNQPRGFQYQLHVEFCRLSDPAVCCQHHHFAAVHLNRLFRMTRRVKGADSFQNHEFCGRPRGKKSGAACDCCSHCGCIDVHGRAAGGDLQKDGAAGQVKIAGALFEAENRVGAKPGNGEIGEGQFCARRGAGAHCFSQRDRVVYDRRPRSGMCPEQPHVLNHLRNAGLM